MFIVLLFVILNYWITFLDINDINKKQFKKLYKKLLQFTLLCYIIILSTGSSQNCIGNKIKTHTR